MLVLLTLASSSSELSDAPVGPTCLFRFWPFGAFLSVSASVQNWWLVELLPPLCPSFTSWMHYLGHNISTPASVAGIVLQQEEWEHSLGGLGPSKGSIPSKMCLQHRWITIFSKINKSTILVNSTFHVCISRDFIWMSGGWVRQLMVGVHESSMYNAIFWIRMIIPHC